MCVCVYVYVHLHLQNVFGVLFWQIPLSEMQVILQQFPHQTELLWFHDFWSQQWNAFYFSMFCFLFKYLTILLQTDLVTKIIPIGQIQFFKH